MGGGDDVGRPVRATATGAVTSAATILRSVSLTAGSDAATLTLRNGGSGEPIIQTLKCPANDSRHFLFHGSHFDKGIHATFAGTSPEATFEI